MLSGCKSYRFSSWKLSNDTVKAMLSRKRRWKMMIFAHSKGHFSPGLRFFVDKIKKAKWQKCPISHLSSFISFCLHLTSSDFISLSLLYDGLLMFVDGQNYCYGCFACVCLEKTLSLHLAYVVCLKCAEDVTDFLIFYNTKFKRKKTTAIILALDPLFWLCFVDPSNPLVGLSSPHINKSKTINFLQTTP